MEDYKYDNEETIAKISDITGFSNENIRRFLANRPCSRLFGYKIDTRVFFELCLPGQDMQDGKLYGMFADAWKLFPARCVKLIPRDLQHLEDGCVSIISNDWSNFFHESLDWGNSAAEADSQAQSDLEAHIVSVFAGTELSDVLENDCAFEEFDSVVYPDRLEDDYDNDFRYLYRAFES